MTLVRPGLRRSTWAQTPPKSLQEAAERIQALEQALGENLRDLDSPRRTGVPMQLIDLESAFVTPIYIGLPSEPRGGLILMRCQRLPDVETPMPITGQVSCVWDGAASRARITAIGGLTPSPAILYRFTFLVVG